MTPKNNHMQAPTPQYSDPKLEKSKKSKITKEKFYILSHKKNGRFFKIYSRFRKDTMLLTPDLDSTQNLASYRTFRGPNSSLLVKLENVIAH